MSKIGFLELIKKYNLQDYENIAVDDVNGYPITIQFEQQSNLTLIQFELSKKLYDEIGFELENELKGVGFKKINYTNQIIRLPVKNKENIQQLYGELRNIISTKIASYANELVCPYCQRSGGDTLVLKNNIYTRVHRNCHDSNLELLSKEINKTGTLADYLKGAFGAFIGASLLMLVAFSLIAITNTSFGWLYVLSVTTAIQGYKLMKGAYGAKAMVIIIAASCVAFIIFLYVTSFYSLYQVGLTSVFTFTELFEVINEIIFSADFFELFGFETIFFLLGIVASFISNPFSKKKIQNNQNKMEKLTKTIPMG